MNKRYTKKTITRVFARKYEDAALLELWLQKERSIRFWIDKHSEALHRADNYYRENLILREAIQDAIVFFDSVLMSGADYRRFKDWRDNVLVAIERLDKVQS